jgi:hypothetical protein
MICCGVEWSILSVNCLGKQIIKHLYLAGVGGQFLLHLCVALTFLSFYHDFYALDPGS